MSSDIADREGFEPTRDKPSTSINNAPAGGFNLREMYAAIYRSRVPIIAIMVSMIAIAIVYSLVATRYYRSTVTIEVRQEAEKVLGTEADREGGASRGDTEKFLQTQLDIIRSRGVANAVAQSKGYYRGTNFLVRMKAIDADDADEPIPVDIRREQVIAALLKGLKAEFSGNTRIADLSFQSPDAALAAEVANAYADAFIRNNLNRKFNSSSYALDFLRDQLREAQERLQKSERDALAYGRQTRIIDVSNAAGSSASGSSPQPQSLVTARLVQLNQSYSAALSDRIQAEQKWRQTNATPLMNIPEVLNSSAIQQLLDQQAQLEATYRQELSTRQADHPAVQRAAAQLAAIKGQITGIAGNIRRSVQAPYEVAMAREREIAGELERLKNNTLTEQSQGIQLSILRREADTNRQQYDSLLRRYNELNAEAGVQTNNLNIVDRADVPRATAWPKPLLNLALAIAVGLILSMGFVIARQQLFDGIRTPDDITDRLRLSFLGSTPVVADPKGEIDLPKSTISEAFGSIRTSLMMASNHGLPRTLMVTSTQAQEGKSSASQALAVSLGRLGRKVVVVDVDFRRPNVHRMFGVSNKQGLSGVVAGQLSLDQAVQESSFDNVSFVPAGALPPNPAEMISSERMKELTRELSSRFDLVLFDSAPVLGLADAVILASEIEATLFIIEAGRNSVRGVQAALARLDQGGARIVGAVLTKFDPSRFGYGQGDAYGYNYSYDYAEK
ncbi:polysaccharide biosynthesis tyrosine autokinase (plasmid) [Sphingomonadaceae bacterium OTU29LAMAA1]|nr:polysaccharide biosynthesis tyrosine autokinase [Sphingomonadaceae bacterium OTU29LAMAA1]